MQNDIHIACIQRVKYFQDQYIIIKYRPLHVVWFIC